jgi:DNA repair protein RAD5
MSLLAQWKQEAINVLGKKCNIQVYYGGSRDIVISKNVESSQFDLVLTTYGVVQSEYAGEGTQNSIFEREWYRVILDEAHLIKNQRSKTAQGCFALKSVIKWVRTIPILIDPYSH